VNTIIIVKTGIWRSWKTPKKGNRLLVQVVSLVRDTLDRIMLILVLTGLLSVVSATDPMIWPQPQYFSFGNGQTVVSSHFFFNLDGLAQKSSVLGKAVERYTKLINPVASSSPNGLQECRISVMHYSGNEQDEIPFLGMDESYQLSVSEGECNLSGQTVWGALRALETFSQLCQRGDDNTHDTVVIGLPTEIKDKPSYSHRGVMIDSARHYLSVESIEHLVDAMSMSKFSVLHWHVVDAESFPFQTPSSSDLLKGAYSHSAIYTQEDVKHITQFCSERGVRLIIEINQPGHSASWTKGYPQIMSKCFKKYSYNYNDFALNPTLDETFQVVSGALHDARTATVDKFIHLGGDEVVYGCWEEDESIQLYKEKQGITSNDQLYGEYITRTERMLDEMGASPIQWHDVFVASQNEVTNGGKAFNFVKSAVFQVWETSGDIIKDVITANYSCIASPDGYWYLDKPASTWDVMYYYDPSVGIPTDQLKKLLGGEAVMFGEHVDDANLESIIFPRAAAVAERLWSNRAAHPDDAATHSILYDSDKEETQDRLAAHRCRMNARNVKAAPLSPSYCDVKYV